MKVPVCPFCKRRLPHLTVRFDNEVAVKVLLQVVRSRNIVSLAELAFIYAKHADCKERSARRAIHRLERNGILNRWRPGYYQAVKNV